MAKNAALALVEAKKHVDQIYVENEQKASIDLDHVMLLAGRGMTVPQIAALIGISSSELKTRIAASQALDAAIKKGTAEGIATVTGKLFEMAAEGNLQAIMFYLRTIGGWNDGKGSGDSTNTKVGNNKQVRVYLPDNGRN